ncbi:MAG TPA: restriction endonuclease subunit S [Bacteroidales bacterium]|nr:restriction endonuclease subunit S [Bacteroidales bacterium]
MSKWYKEKIGCLAETYAGGTPSRSNPEYFMGNIPWISSGELNQPRILQTNESITEEALNNSSAKWIPKNSVLIAMYGATAGQVSTNLIDATSNQAVLALIPDDELIDGEFLFYSLLNSKNDILFLTQGTGQPNLSKGLIDNFSINVPKCKFEQRRIAQILSTCDAVIEKTQSAIAKYKVIKQGMLHDLFTRGIDIQTGKLRPHYKDAPELYKESKLGWIPKEWECEMLSSIIEIISGGTPSTQIKEYWDGEIPWLSVDDFNTGNRYPSKAAKKITEEGLKKSATNMLLPGMLIISARGTVGVIAQMKAPMAFNQSCYGLNTVNEYLSNDYLYYYLTFFIRFIGFKSYGSVFDVITRSSFDEVFIPINKKSDEQRMIVEKLTAIDTKLHSEQSYLEKMQQIKKGLMEDLLSGKKRVEV